MRNNVKMTGLYSCRRCNGRFPVYDALTANNNEEWEKLAAIYVSGFSMDDLTEIFNSFASQKMFEKVGTFYSKGGSHATSANGRAANQTVELVRANMNWLIQARDSVWLFLEPSDDGDEWYESTGFIVGMSVLGGVLCCLLIACLVRILLKKKKSDGYSRAKDEGPEQPTRSGYGS